MEFYIRLTETRNCCSNVNSMYEQMTMFIEGHTPTNRKIVSQYRQENPKVPFLRFFQYAKEQDAAIRAGNKKSKKVTLQEPTRSARTKTLHPN